MDTIFINSKNSKTSDSYRLLLNLSDKRNPKRSDKYKFIKFQCILSSENIKKSYNNNKFKASALTQNKKFQLSENFR